MLYLGGFQKFRRDRNHMGPISLMRLIWDYEKTQNFKKQCNAGRRGQTKKDGFFTFFWRSLFPEKNVSRKAARTQRTEKTDRFLKPYLFLLFRAKNILDGVKNKSPLPIIGLITAVVNYSSVKKSHSKRIPIPLPILPNHHDDGIKFF
jgi:hypothetical protein